MISITDAQTFAEQQKLKSIIIFGWDGSKTTVTTWGDTDTNSSAAAQGANQIKKGWSWPANTIVESAKVQALYDQIIDLKKQILAFEEQIDNISL